MIERRASKLGGVRVWLVRNAPRFVFGLLTSSLRVEGGFGIFERCNRLIDRFSFLRCSEVILKHVLEIRSRFFFSYISSCVGEYG